MDAALKNLKTSINKIPVVSIGTKDDDILYDIMIERPDMIETLEQNLEILIEVEDYKRCHEAKKIIDKEQMKINLNNDPWVDEDEDEGYNGYSANDGEDMDGEDGYRDSDYDY